MPFDLDGDIRKVKKELQGMEHPYATANKYSSPWQTWLIFVHEKLVERAEKFALSPLQEEVPAPPQAQLTPDSSRKAWVTLTPDD